MYALKHGAKLVWGPETVDKAILHTTRAVDRESSLSVAHHTPVHPAAPAATGVVAYHGKSRAIFTCHPIERPFLIYQIGSADPELAVQAAKMVQQDVAGFDLNCGCPKPFSTHSGMGAALLTNPDLLCSILTALREAMPPEITVSAKIRLLPSQEDTLKLVERVVNTGISCLTVHCRTRNMRMREKATIERLREIVEFVERMGKGTAVIENGDCLGYEDLKRVRQVTGAFPLSSALYSFLVHVTRHLAGAHSVMIATAAEANPTCFSPTPLKDLELTFVPAYIRLVSPLPLFRASVRQLTCSFDRASTWTTIGPPPSFARPSSRESTTQRNGRTSRHYAKPLYTPNATRISRSTSRRGLVSRSSRRSSRR